MNISEIQGAKSFVKDVPVREPFKLWCVYVGRGIPCDRDWYLTDSKGEIVSKLSQSGLNSDDANTIKRRQWIEAQGALGLLWRRNAEGNLEQYDPYTVPKSVLAAANS
jgi:hypothetical protein